MQLSGCRLPNCSGVSAEKWNLCGSGPRPRCYSRYAPRGDATPGQPCPIRQAEVRSGSFATLAVCASTAPMSQVIRKRTYVAIFDCYVSAFGISRFIQAFVECVEEVCELSGRGAVEIANHRHRRLLRAHSERPNSRAAKYRNELAPPHSITSSARSGSCTRAVIGEWLPS
jgi:hypothetical protein